MKELIVECWTDILIIILAGDLLYLYFAGSWSDPILAIEVLELIILFSALIFGCWRLIMFIRKKQKVD